MTEEQIERNRANARERYHRIKAEGGYAWEAYKENQKKVALRYRETHKDYVREYNRLYAQKRRKELNEQSNSNGKINL